jgi:hypothetical protein
VQSRDSYVYTQKKAEAKGAGGEQSKEADSTP